MQAAVYTFSVEVYTYTMLEGIILVCGIMWMAGMLHSLYRMHVAMERIQARISTIAQNTPDSGAPQVFREYPQSLKSSEDTPEPLKTSENTPEPLKTTENTPETLKTFENTPEPLTTTPLENNPPTGSPYRGPWVQQVVALYRWAKQFEESAPECERCIELNRKRNRSQPLIYGSCKQVQVVQGPYFNNASGPTINEVPGPSFREDPSPLPPLLDVASQYSYTLGVDTSSEPDTTGDS